MSQPAAALFGILGRRETVGDVRGPIQGLAGDTIVLDPFAPDSRRTQLDARIRATRFAGRHILVVSTVAGLVLIRLSVRGRPHDEAGSSRPT